MLIWIFFGLGFDSVKFKFPFLPPFMVKEASFLEASHHSSCEKESTCVSKKGNVKSRFQLSIVDNNSWYKCDCDGDVT